MDPSIYTLIIFDFTIGIIVGGGLTLAGVFSGIVIFSKD